MTTPLIVCLPAMGCDGCGDDIIVSPGRVRCGRCERRSRLQRLRRVGPTRPAQPGDKRVKQGAMP